MQQILAVTVGLLVGALSAPGPSQPHCLAPISPSVFLRSPSWVHNADFTPDNARIVTGSDDGARIWDVKTGALLHFLPSGGERVFAVFARDGTRVVTGTERTVWVWDAVTGSRLFAVRPPIGQTLNGPNIYAAQIAAQPSGNTVVVWNVQTAQTLFILKGPTKPVARARGSQTMARASWQ